MKYLSTLLLIIITGCNSPNNTDYINKNGTASNMKVHFIIPSNKLGIVLLSTEEANPNKKTIIRLIQKLCNEIHDIDKRVILIYNSKKYLYNDLWRNEPLITGIEKKLYNESLIGKYSSKNGSLNIYPRIKRKSIEIVIGNKWCKKKQTG